MTKAQPTSICVLLSLCPHLVGFSAPSIQVDRGGELSWYSEIGRSYQLQHRISGKWQTVGGNRNGTGDRLTSSAAPGAVPADIRVVETTSAIPAVANALANGGFELGSGNSSTSWASQGNIHTRVQATSSPDEVSAGSFSHRAFIQNVGATPNSGNLTQMAAILPSASYSLVFRARQISQSSSYVQTYEIQWQDAANVTLGTTGGISFRGGTDSWATVTSANFVPPANATQARLNFYFATGAISGATGGVLLDEIALQTADGQPSQPAQSQVVAVRFSEQMLYSWDTENGALYQPMTSETLETPTWILHDRVVGNGGVAQLTQPARQRQFFSVAYPSEIGTAQPAAYTPLYSTATAKQPEVLENTATALVTRLADRARDRHAREDIVNGVPFRTYDHYLSFYWEQRISEIEIVDRVAKGGEGVTFNFMTHARLNPAEFRTYYGNSPSVAMYLNNMSDENGQGVTLVRTQPSAKYPGETEYHYTASILNKRPENRKLQLGDRVEVELSQFLSAPRNGRANYYGTAFLYVVGQGVLPWYAKFKEEALGAAAREVASFDSFPLPEMAWLGGRTTLPYQYSNEPLHRFKQLAGNISPTNGHEFMLGRRLHHTNFVSGAHSESGNPIFAAHVGKAGPAFVANSCVACHVNNGRSSLPEVGQQILQHAIVKVGSNAQGSAHAGLGEQIQPQATNGSPEATVTLTGWENTAGSFADGTPYTLRKPIVAFSGNSGASPEFYSLRTAPPLVGLGLLEAINETSIQALADPSDANADGISGRVAVVADLADPTVQRMGRFTPKGSQATVKQQIATAFNRDMGITSVLQPTLDGQTGSPSASELTDKDLEQLTTYVSLLGVSARRELSNAEALRGEALFAEAHCTACHIPALTTGPHHPMAELRNQTIHPYTDLLLHDLGPGLAATMGEKTGTAAEWRTTPLWNIGLTAQVGGGKEAYLHDGRAQTLEEAILWHGGEAEAAREKFRTMPAADRSALIAFLRSL